MVREGLSTKGTTMRSQACRPLFWLQEREQKAGLQGKGGVGGEHCARAHTGTESRGWHKDGQLGLSLGNWVMFWGAGAGYSLEA